MFFHVGKIPGIQSHRGVSEYWPIFSKIVNLYVGRRFVSVEL